MRTKVTVIVVAQRGGEWLAETLTGLREQSYAPSEIVGVINGVNSGIQEQFAAAGVQRIVGVPSKVSFGQAVARAVQTLPAFQEGAQVQTADSALQALGGSVETAARVDEWLWLLSEDVCPEPRALERILQAVHRSPSVGVAGPKLVDWDNPEYIIELGQTLTTTGSRWLLRRQELDQQQYDHLQDVLGVGPVGMFVRRDIWDELAGFDPALKVYDDGLDFCVRARRAGHRVEVAPASRVRFAQLGIAGPRIDRSRAVLRTAHRQARASQLHRRIAYAPAAVAFLTWLCLPAWGVLRMLWALIREQPGNMLGELFAALKVYFSVPALLNSRKRMRKTSRFGWDVLKQLRQDTKSVRTARMIDREAILAQTGRQRQELHFISTGGLGVLIAALVLGIVCTWWALPQVSLTGGALAPLDNISELWRNTRPQDGIPADPFAWVLALVGTITFWNPSQAIVALLVLAFPLAALGGWIWAATVTESRAGRALFGLAFAINPVLVTAVHSGRIATVILAAVLPWLVFTAVRARESWSYAGTASLLAGVALAAAPSLLPAAIVFFLVGLCTSFRGFAKMLTVGIVPVVIFAPKVIVSILHGKPLAVFLDPGISPAYKPGTVFHMLLGFPEYGLGGWPAILGAIGIQDVSESLLVGLLFVPLVALAVIGLFAVRTSRQLLFALLGGVGMLSAVAAAHLSLSAEGNIPVPLWSGSGLLLYWFALLGFAACGVPILRRVAAPLVSLAVICAVAVVAPLGAQLVLKQVPFVPGNQQMPALVQAAGETHPGMKTLVLMPLADGAVRASYVEGAGLRLDDIRAHELATDLSADDKHVAALVGSLASAGDSGLAAKLEKLRVGFVLLQGNDGVGKYAGLQMALDQHDALAGVGKTAQGLLWRVVDAPSGAHPAGDEWQKLTGTSFTGKSVWILQLILLGAMILLALPTGEVTYRPEKRKRKQKQAKAGGGKAQQLAAEQLVPVAPGQAAEAAAAAAESSAAPAESSAAPTETTAKEEA